MFKSPLSTNFLLMTTLVITLFSCSGNQQRTHQRPIFSVMYDPMLSFIKVGKELARKHGDLRQFSAEIINISNLPEKLRYKFKFYDRDGFQVAPFSRSWKPVLLSPYETVSLQAVSPDAKAISARLFLEKRQ